MFGGSYVGAPREIDKVFDVISEQTVPGGGYRSTTFHEEDPVAPGLGQAMFIMPTVAATSTAFKPLTEGNGQCLMPVTLKMLVQERLRMLENGENAQLHIHGRPVNMFMVVGVLKTLEQRYNQQLLTLDDGSGEIVVSRYVADIPEQAEALTTGRYIRICGSTHMWNGNLKMSVHNLKVIKNLDEVPYHSIEVLHAYLALTNQLKKKEEITYPPEHAIQAPPRQVAGQFGAGR